VLFVTHDREVIERAATSILTLEPGPSGATCWEHHGGYSAYQDAREARNDRLDEVRRRWDEKEQQLIDLVEMYKQKAAYNSDMASRYQAAKSRLQRFQQTGRPEASPKTSRITMRLAGSRTGKRALTATGLSFPDLFEPFDLEAWYGDRIAVVGSNGTGKSHFLAAIADHEGPNPEWVGEITLGARVRAGHFSQVHERPDLAGRVLTEILHRGTSERDGMPRDVAMPILSRYGLAGRADTRFDALSGGQQARFQILLLEVAGNNLLLLDEPTDNLDLASVEALEYALQTFDGTVVAVTHDRWFARQFDRFLAFGDRRDVAEVDQPVWGSRTIRA
jgi:ATPase subunit of ABC transporter with duplicated ATPase domains